MKPLVFRGIVAGSVALVSGLLLMSQEPVSRGVPPAPPARGEVPHDERLIRYAIVYCRTDSSLKDVARGDNSAFDVSRDISDNPLAAKDAEAPSLQTALAARHPQCRWRIEHMGKFITSRIGTIAVASDAAKKRVSPDEITEKTEYRPPGANEAVAFWRYDVSHIDYTLSGKIGNGSLQVGAVIERRVKADGTQRPDNRLKPHPSDVTALPNPIPELESGGGGGSTSVPLGTSGWRYVCATGPGSLACATWPGQHMVFVYVP